MQASPTPMDDLPSSNRNIHVVSHTQDGNMLLAPGFFLRNLAFLLLCSMPLWLFLCAQYNAAQELRFAAVLFPLLGAVSLFIVQFCNSKFGTRILLNSKTRTIQITGSRHGSGKTIPFDQVVSVQMLTEGKRGQGGKGGTWTSYQVNFVFTNGERTNLLNSAGKRQLALIAQALAKRIGIPFETHEKSQ